MIEPQWILDDVVLSIHSRQIAEHGGLDDVRDSGLLMSVLGKPKNMHYYHDPKPDIADLAASYAYGIVKNHPFVDGNKRTAFVVANLFLRLNGTTLHALQEQKYVMFLGLASGQVTEEELAAFIRNNMTAIIAK